MYSEFFSRGCSILPVIQILSQFEEFAKPINTDWKMLAETNERKQIHNKLCSMLPGPGSKTPVAPSLSDTAANCSFSWAIVFFFIGSW